jgi:SNF2 family DNA or RNA helicase
MASPSATHEASDVPLASGVHRVPGVGVVSGVVCICQRSDPYGRYLMVPCADGTMCNGWVHPQCVGMHRSIYEWIFDPAVASKRMHEEQTPFFCPMCITAACTGRKLPSTLLLPPPLVQQQFTMERILAHRVAQPKNALEDVHAIEALHVHAATDATLAFPDHAVVEGAAPSSDSHKDEFLIKWKDRSYLHCSWETLETLVDIEYNYANSEFVDETTKEGDGATRESLEARMRTKIRRFLEKNQSGIEEEGSAVATEPSTEENLDDGTFFNAAFTYAERVIASTVANTDDEHRMDADIQMDAGLLDVGSPPHKAGFRQPGLKWRDVIEHGIPAPLYLVKWVNLPYSECSWETATDVGDATLIQQFRFHEQIPIPLQQVQSLLVDFPRARPKQTASTKKSKAAEPKAAVRRPIAKKRRVVEDEDADEMMGQHDGSDAVASDEDEEQRDDSEDGDEFEDEDYRMQLREAKVAHAKIQHLEAALRVGGLPVPLTSTRHLAARVPRYRPSPEEFSKLEESHAKATSPADVQLALHDYQLEGVNWLLFNFFQGRASILADEMGLGKTAQALFFLKRLTMQSFLTKSAADTDSESEAVVVSKRRPARHVSKVGTGAAEPGMESFGRVSGPFLVVVPLSTLGHWVREIDTWTAGAAGASKDPNARASSWPLNVVAYHGSAAARQIIRDREFSYFDPSTGVRLHDVDGELPPEFVSLVDRKVGRAAAGAYRQYKFDIMLTTYEMINNDAEYLSAIDWRCIVVDEAHRLKNSTSKLSKTLSSWQREHCVLLTGTPIQNTIDELWALLRFVAPGVFVESEGESVADAGLSRVLKAIAASPDVQLPRSALPSTIDRGSFMKHLGVLERVEQITCLHMMLKPYLLRRLKEDVKMTLPPKEETLVEVELTSVQKQYYRAIYERNVQFLLKAAQTFNKATQGARHLPSLMNIVMELRKVCNHPYLLRGVEDVLAARCIADLAQASPEKPPQSAIATALQQQFVKLSGKFVLLDKLLPRLQADGHRVLIFSQMVRTLDLIADYAAIRKYSFERIDGRIRGVDRQNAIDRFCAEASTTFMMLLSTRAGGLGINLTAADTVILFDSDWNPQNDLQAQARVHRIGQTKPIKIYRLLTRKTYEQIMFQKASKKLGLDKAVVGTLATDNSMGQRVFGGSAAGDPNSALEIERLLRMGAYDVFDDKEDKNSKEFNEEDIDSILSRSVTVLRYDDGSVTDAGERAAVVPKFNKASFVSADASEVDIDDPHFWEKALGGAVSSAPAFDKNQRAGFAEEMPAELKRRMDELHGVDQKQSGGGDLDDVAENEGSESDEQEVGEDDDGDDENFSVRRQRGRGTAAPKLTLEERRDRKVIRTITSVLESLLAKVEHQVSKAESALRSRRRSAGFATKTVTLSDSSAVAVPSAAHAAEVAFDSVFSNARASSRSKFETSINYLGAFRVRTPWTVLEVRRLLSALRDFPIGRWDIIQRKYDFSHRSVQDVKVTLRQYLQVLLAVGCLQLTAGWVRGTALRGVDALLTGKDDKSQTLQARLRDLARLSGAISAICPDAEVRQIPNYIFENFFRQTSLRKAAKGAKAGAEAAADADDDADKDDDGEGNSCGDFIKCRNTIDRCNHLLMVRDYVVVAARQTSESEYPSLASSAIDLVNYPVGGTEAEDLRLAKFMKVHSKPAGRKQRHEDEEVTDMIAEELNRDVVLRPIDFFAEMPVYALPSKCSEHVMVGTRPPHDIEQAFVNAKAKFLSSKDSALEVNYGFDTATPWHPQKLADVPHAGVLPFDDVMINQLDTTELRGQLPTLRQSDDCPAFPKTPAWWNVPIESTVEAGSELLLRDDQELALAIYKHGLTGLAQAIYLDTNLTFRSTLRALYCRLPAQKRMVSWLPAAPSAKAWTANWPSVFEFAVVSRSAVGASHATTFALPMEVVPAHLQGLLSQLGNQYVVVRVQQLLDAKLKLRFVDPALGDSEVAASARGALLLSVGSGELMRLQGRSRRLLAHWQQSYVNLGRDAPSEWTLSDASQYQKQALNAVQKISSRFESMVSAIDLGTPVQCFNARSDLERAAEAALKSHTVPTSDAAVAVPPPSDGAATSSFTAHLAAATMVDPESAAKTLLDACQAGKFLPEIVEICSVMEDSRGNLATLTASPTVLGDAQISAKWSSTLDSKSSNDLESLTFWVTTGASTAPLAVAPVEEDEAGAAAPKRSRKSTAKAAEAVTEYWPVSDQQNAEGLWLALDASKPVSHYMRCRVDLLTNGPLADKSMSVRESLRLKTAGIALASVIAKLESDALIALNPPKRGRAAAAMASTSSAPPPPAKRVRKSVGTGLVDSSVAEVPQSAAAPRPAEQATGLGLLQAAASTMAASMDIDTAI